MSLTFRQFDDSMQWYTCLKCKWQQNEPIKFRRHYSTDCPLCGCCTSTQPGKKKKWLSGKAKACISCHSRRSWGINWFNFILGETAKNLGNYNGLTQNAQHFSCNLLRSHVLQPEKKSFSGLTQASKQLRWQTYPQIVQFFFRRPPENYLLIMSNIRPPAPPSIPITHCAHPKSI